MRAPSPRQLCAQSLDPRLVDSPSGALDRGDFDETIRASNSSACPAFAKSR